MKTNITTIIASAVVLSTLRVGAEVWATSAEVSLDTRSISAIAAEEDQNLDTRSFTEDWSAPRTLNTKKIVGTVLLIR